MTPIGHVSVSYITGKSYKKISLPAIIIGGMLPDFDFLFMFFDWFNQVHRVISHNLLFIIGASLLASAFTSEGRKQAIGLSVFLGGSIHLFIDSFMDINPTNGTGIALLWPFSDAFYSPFNLLYASLSVPGWSEPFKMIRILIPGMLYEVPFYILSVLLLITSKEK